MVDRDRGVVETENGEEIYYDACVLATGSEPIRLPIPGADDPAVLVMRTIENSERLQSRATEGSRAVVVGSGFIGCEAAASLSLRGAGVALVSRGFYSRSDRIARRRRNSPHEARGGCRTGNRKRRRRNRLFDAHECDGHLRRRRHSLCHE